jgi:hypothetical protein
LTAGVSPAALLRLVRGAVFLPHSSGNFSARENPQAALAANNRRGSVAAPLSVDPAETLESIDQ